MARPAEAALQRRLVEAMGVEPRDLRWLVARNAQPVIASALAAEELAAAIRVEGEKLFS